MNNVRPEQIGKYFIFALAAAVVVSLIFIIPAEYGKDPTGLGKALGLTKLASNNASTQPASNSSDTIQVYVDENESTVTVTNSLDNIDLTNWDFTDPSRILKMGNKVVAIQPQPFLTSAKQYTLSSGERIEVKAVLNKGETIVYSWAANHEVYVDFHGHPPDGSPEAANYPENFFVRYSEGVMTDESGSLIAPFAGEHGWFWQNLGTDPVTIQLQVSGFYSEIKHYGEE